MLMICAVCTDALKFSEVYFQLLSHFMYFALGIYLVVSLMNTIKSSSFSMNSH